MTSNKVDAQITLRLDAMTYGGEAIGRLDGKAIFVRGGIAGEKVQAQVIEDRGHFARATVVNVLDPSPDRVQPRCPHFGFEARSCGGCHWQHMDYAAQLHWKTEIVREQLRRIGRLPDAPVRATIPSPDVWAYRNHAQFSITPDGRPGFQAARSNRVIPIDECHIVQLPILEHLHSIRLQPGAERLDVRSFNLQSPISVNGALFQVSAASFFQVNTSLIPTMMGQVVHRLALQGGETVLDAYCGVGLFSHFVAPKAGRVIGIESSPSAVQDARHNLAEFAQVDLRESLVEDVLPTLDVPIDVAIFDPPRAGCGPKVIQAVIERQIERVVYVSCDPSTLARDARQLMDGGYGLVDVQPLDMFPHTFHIETISTWVCCR
jgi:23S rRNA (uracil1939-C5)-methyltransferase